MRLRFGADNSTEARGGGFFGVLKRRRGEEEEGEAVTNVAVLISAVL